MMQKALPKWDSTEKYRGIWWSADTPESRFSGVLRMVDARALLTVSSPVVGQEVYQLAHTKLVHGELETGELVTLWDLQQHALQYLRTGKKSMKHRRYFTYAILGEHLDSYTDARFRYSAYRLHGMTEWSAMGGEPIPIGLPEEELPHYETAVLPNFADDESGTNYDVEIRIEYPQRIEKDRHFSGGVIANHPGDDARVVFECMPPAPVRIHELLLFDFQALMTFSKQEGAPIEGQWFAAIDQAFPMPVIRRDSFKGHAPPRHTNPHNLVLTAALVAPAELFPIWWKVIHELYPATQVITSYHHGSRGILEASVSSVIAVAERLHGIIGPTTTRFPEGYLESKKEDVKKAFPGKENAEFRLFLYEALRNNRPILRTRLEELASAVTSDRLNSMGIEKKLWIQDVRAVRDRIAHTASHVQARGDDESILLDRVNVQTRAIVTILILTKMGVTDKVLDHAAQALSESASMVRQLV